MTDKKTDHRTKPATKAKSAQKTSYPLFRPLFAVGRFFRGIGRKMGERVRGLLARRPHRSFYLTARQDARRGLKIDSYGGFTMRVWRMMIKNRGLFIKYFIFYGIAAFCIVGLASQENFVAFRDAINNSDGYEGITKWVSLFSNAIASGGSSTLDASQQILSAILFLYGWLTIIWLLRAIMRGDDEKIKLRDGLYSSGSPILSTLAVAVVVVLQLLPLGLVTIAYTSITAVGWINTGVAIENMAAWCALAVAAILTIYWISSSLIALIIVTLPGTYPFVAIRAAGDLMVGRRLKLTLRLLFMMLPVALLWLLILMPAIFVDSWLKLTWFPLVPLVVFLLGILTMMWIATYIYMLYRQIVDDPTPPVSARILKKPTKLKKSVKSQNAAKSVKKPKSSKQ